MIRSKVKPAFLPLPPHGFGFFCMSSFYIIYRLVTIVKLLAKNYRRFLYMRYAILISKNR